LFWRVYLRLKGARVGCGFCVRGPIDLLLRDGASLRTLSIGDNVTFGGRTYIRIRKQGQIVIEDNVQTGTEVWLVAANDQELRVGSNSALGSYCILNGGHGLRIGSDCTLAGFVYINTSDHGFAKGTLIREQGFFGAPVEIGRDVWLGGHVFVNKGTRIGDGVVVGAGAVVVKDLPENVIAAGVPARAIRERT
jgi:acetyltransferase-like isoleucine patch superfamily enzyme